MVVHDLRGPATSINLGAELALKSVKKMVRSNFKQNTNMKTKLSGTQQNVNKLKFFRSQSVSGFFIKPRFEIAKNTNMVPVIQAADEGDKLKKILQNKHVYKSRCFNQDESKYLLNPQLNFDSGYTNKLIADKKNSLVKMDKRDLQKLQEIRSCESMDSQSVSSDSLKSNA